MAATLDVSPEERAPLAFVLAVEIGHLGHGTKEHQEIAQGLRDVYTSLLDAPDGTLMLEFSNDELYMVGVRLFADSSELEEWWLDHRASMSAIREAALFPDENFGRAVQRFFPEVIEDPLSWSFEPYRAIYLGLGRKIDQALREFVPNVRGIYNRERAEINRRTLRMQRERAERRSRRYPGGTRAEMWRRAIRADQAGVGDMVGVEIEGRKIVVANTGDGYYAIDAVCTHIPALAAISDLSNGRLDVEQHCVSCPWHGSQFDLRTGRVVRQPYAPEFNREHLFSGRITGVLDPKKTATDTRVYPTKIAGNYVMVNIA